MTSVSQIGRTLPATGLELETDVLVIGGGPAAAWASISAAAGRSRVVLVDKGFCGTSGATAPSGTGVWYVRPDTASRIAAKQSRWTLGGMLADSRWMDRVLDRTYANINQLAEWGYPFHNDPDGEPMRNTLQGPDYMRLMRRRVKAAGVRILDHCPALELLVDANGTVSGAAGLRRQKGDHWKIRAKAVVLATGGCAFLSKALGCNVLTGDGHLMSAELGAEFSGMEFSTSYAMAVASGSVTKTRYYDWAAFTHADGSPVEGAMSRGGRSKLARVLAHEPVYARLEGTDAQTRAVMRYVQPNFFAPFDRMEIDPFAERFPVTLRLEGTVRGTGGLRLIDDSCATTVPGLFAAGDAATRELICGAFTGGGSHNAAWAMSSGFWAGAGARDFAQRRGRVPDVLRGSGKTAIADGPGHAIDALALRKSVQDEVFPFETNYFRSRDGLEASLAKLDARWSETRGAAAAPYADAVRTREAVAMLAVARWMYRSGLARRESRGMHKREDYPMLDPNQRHHIVTGGLDEVWTRALNTAPASQEGLVA